MSVGMENTQPDTYESVVFLEDAARASFLKMTPRKWRLVIAVSVIFEFPGEAHVSVSSSAQF